MPSDPEGRILLGLLVNRPALWAKNNAVDIPARRDMIARGWMTPGYSEITKRGRDALARYLLRTWRP